MSKYFTYIVKYSGRKKTIKTQHYRRHATLSMGKRKGKHIQEQENLKTNAIKSNTKGLKNNNDMEKKIQWAYKTFFPLHCTQSEGR